MRLLILGAGGIGGYFGGRLVEAGADVTVLVRPKRAEQLARDGLVIESSLGDVRRPVRAIVRGESRGSFDLVLLACKAYDLDSAIDAVAPHLSAGGAILPLLNGIKHVDTLVQSFGADRVLGGSCHIGVTMTSTGVIRHLNRRHSLTFGELSGERSDRVIAFAEIAGQANIESRLSTTIVQDLWDKLVFLATLAGATCLMRAAIGDVMHCAEGRWLITSLLRECESIAAASGHAPSTDFMDGARQQLTDERSPSTASMLRDMWNGHRTEADHILGDLISRALAARIEVPLLRAAYCHLQAYELARRRAEPRAQERCP